MREPVLAEEIELLRVEVEHRTLIVNDRGREVQRVAHAKVQGQTPRRAKIVLDEELGYLRAGLDGLRLRIHAEPAHLSQQERGERIPGVRNYGAGRCQS